MIVIQDSARLQSSIALHEGLKLKPYLDTTGHLTVGYGHNLTAKGISQAVAALMLQEDILDALLETQQILPWVADLNDVRKRAFVEIVYNMGSSVLGFHQALACAQAGDWPGCAREFANSRWDAQVGHRADVLEGMLATGIDD